MKNTLTAYLQIQNQIFDNELQNTFSSNAQDTWNHIVNKFSAMQLHPYLKANDFNVQEDAMTAS